MVDSLRVGGLIIEQRAFAQNELGEDQEDLRVYLASGGIRMEEAMGPTMSDVGDSPGVREEEHTSCSYLEEN
jgi:hypothetical protein